tara:strand:- start:330 stop:563 length:234 start_codon:yes stop_codon:yes gene_type:complete
MTNETIKKMWQDTLKEMGRDEGRYYYDDYLFETFAENVAYACANVVIECDPSVKCIVHEPYRSISEAVHNTFESGEH